MQKTIVEMTQAWKKYQPALAPVANFTSIPYSDSEREGTQLNVDGRELQQKVTNAVTQARAYTPQLEKNLAQIISGLQSSSDSLATALRSVVLIGVGLAAALAALVGYLSLARGKQAAAAPAARQQTEDILRTVREGLFLLDADLKIGEIHSDATGAAVPARVRRRHHLRRPAAQPGVAEDAGRSPPSSSKCCGASAPRKT